jgi:hypothetical protein
LKHPEEEGAGSFFFASDGLEMMGFSATAASGVVEVVEGVEGGTATSSDDCLA